ncbi:hypothetical protein D3C76_1234460 [compost metagenome]
MPFNLAGNGTEVADQPVIVGALGLHLDHDVARAGRPGQFGGQVHPGAVAFDVQQAHAGAAVQPFACHPQVLLQVTQGAHIGLDQGHAAKALVLRAGHIIQIHLNAVFVLGQLPVICRLD